MTGPVNPRVGSTLDSLFEELGELDEVKRRSDKKVAWIDASRNGDVVILEDDGDPD